LGGRETQKNPNKGNWRVERKKEKEGDHREYKCVQEGRVLEKRGNRGATKLKGGNWWGRQGLIRLGEVSERLVHGEISHFGWGD